MTVSQTRAARKKIAERYGRARKRRSVSDAISEERSRAARAAAAAKRKK